MNTRNKVLVTFSILLVASLILSACQPAATPPPQPAETIIVTQIVEGTPQVIVVTPTPGAETQAPPPPVPGQPTGPVPADAMVACNPLPAMALGTGSAPRLASIKPPSIPTRLASLSPANVNPQQVTPEGDYLVGVFEDVTSLNVWQANGPDNTVWNAYMLPAQLTLFELSEVNFTFVPAVAAVNEPDPLQEDADGSWFVDIPMRQDVVWSDGTPFTANDVAFTANAVVELGMTSGNWGGWYDSNFLDRMEVIDDYTVRIIYHTRPGLSRHEYGVLQAPIVAAHYWEPIIEDVLADVRALGENPDPTELATAQSDAQTALFQVDPRENGGEPHAGPYIFEAWQPGASLSLVANPDYYLGGVTIEQWNDGSYRAGDIVVGSPQGEPDLAYEVGPFFESIIYFLYGTQDSAILALRNGEVDFTLNSLGLQRGLAEQLRGDPSLQVMENETLGFRYISFNNRRQPMNDCAFRQAVAVLIDKEFVTNTILQGAAFPLYTFVPQGNTAWYYDGVPQLGAGLDRGQRVDLAIEILQQAGFSWTNNQLPEWDPDGLMVISGGNLIMPDGTPVPPLSLLAPSPAYDPLRSTFAIWIESWLREVGIPITAELAGFNVIIPRVYSEQNFDIFMLGWSLTIFPDYLYDFFASEYAVLEGNNAGGYVNPEFDALALELLICQDFDECREIANNIQDILATEVPYVVLFDTGIIEAYNTSTIEMPFTEQLSGIQFTHKGNTERAIRPVGPE
jgi:peptide/nickel transport system substrate-binding protein